MTTLWRDAQTPQRMGAMVSALFGVSGLLLAALGTYGVLAYLVSARAREFGIRQALGARPRDVLSMVLRDGFVLALVGLAVGGALSVAAVQALQFGDHRGRPACRARCRGSSAARWSRRRSSRRWCQRAGPRACSRST